jgi:hypothetical protein
MAVRRTASLTLAYDAPAGPKPLRRGEGPAIHAFVGPIKKDVDARVKPAHDE